jgi:hypothetical protein
MAAPAFSRGVLPCENDDIDNPDKKIQKHARRKKFKTSIKVCDSRCMEPVERWVTKK